MIKNSTVADITARAAAELALADQKVTVLAATLKADGTINKTSLRSALSHIRKARTDASMLWDRDPAARADIIAAVTDLRDRTDVLLIAAANRR